MMRAIARALLAVAAAAVALSSGSGAEKVRLTLYYETLCPYCSRFIVNHLAGIFDDGLIGIVDLELVPYGNALVVNGTIVCQHGEYECFLNTVEACVIQTWPDVNTHFNFINCVEKLVVESTYQEWKSCFPQTGLNSEAVAQCLDSGLGEKLELQYGQKTEALEPRLRYVPWVIVDGQPLYEDYVNFEAYVCKAFKGSNPPTTCQEANLEGSAKIRATDQLSYNDVISLATPETDAIHIAEPSV